MKTIRLGFLLFTSMLAQIQDVRSEEYSRFDTSYGAGHHVDYKVSDWGGKEFVISRVENQSGRFVFARTSKDDFRVFVERGDRRVPVFCMNRNFTTSPIAINNSSMFLVDAWLTEDEAAMLLTDGSKYHYVKSLKKLPVLEKGKHYLISPLDDESEWKYIFSVIYMDLGGSPNEESRGIQSVKMSSVNEIEVVYKRPPADSPDKTKRFNLRDGKLKVNNLIVSAGTNSRVFDEEEFRTILKDREKEGMNLEEFKTDFIRAFGSKDRVIQFFDSFEDKELAEKAKKLIEEAMDQ